MQHAHRLEYQLLHSQSHTKVGVVGIKVWICKGEIFGKRDLSPNIGASNVKPKGGRGPRKDRRD